jgi:hypothetical protein
VVCAKKEERSVLYEAVNLLEVHRKSISKYVCVCVYASLRACVRNRIYENVFLVSVTSLTVKPRWKMKDEINFKFNYPNHLSFSLCSAMYRTDSTEQVEN